MKPFNALIACAAAMCIGVLLPLTTLADPPQITDYLAVPYFAQEAAAAPNIMIQLDNSGSMVFHAYGDEETYSPTKTYYGYFSSNHRYKYSGGQFEIALTDGKWDGNFLNFITSRRIDILRKVLMGGKMLSRVGGGKQAVQGEDADDTYGESRQGSYWKYKISNAEKALKLVDHTETPYIGIRGGDIYVHTISGDLWKSKAKYKIQIQKDFEHERDEFVVEDDDGDDGKPGKYWLGGVLQQFRDKAQWGNIWFADYTKYNGGVISNGISRPNKKAFATNLLTDIGKKTCFGGTPLAETFYTAMLHYMQHVPNGLVKTNKFSPSHGIEKSDPFDLKTGGERCSKNFVLLLTDGASSVDGTIPNDPVNLKNYAETQGSPSHFYTDGTLTITDYLKDVAYYARTNDLRSDIADTQNVYTYTVFAFDTDPQAKNLLMETARQGGFEDRNGNNKPDLQAEWDKNGDGIPDTFFEAQDGASLKNELTKAIEAIIKRAASGTAASVLATNEQGEGNLAQAYFKPTMDTASGEATWLGYMQSTWVDACGNIRDNTGAVENQLDLTGGNPDRIIEYFYDTATSETKIKRYLTHPLYDIDPPYSEEKCAVKADASNSTFETILLEELTPIFEAGHRLWDTDPDDRKIYTFIDKNNNEQIDNGELIEFKLSNKSAIEPYLGINADSYSDYENLGDTRDDRLVNLIEFIRGNHIDLGSMRSRLVTLDNVEKVWKLGDIVHSTPVTVSRPVDNFHLIYLDESYEKYLKDNKNRESMVYVGANDGMLHAFTHWEYDYDSDNGVSKYKQPSGTTEAIGTELWAYIPQALLPHLKWLTEPDYGHVYYVDLKPKVFDAKIGDKWGTFLLLGLRMGGKQIWAKGDFNYSGSYSNSSNSPDDVRVFHSSYTLIDITIPREPKVMWERSYDNLGLTMSFPAVVKVDQTTTSAPQDDKNPHWYAVFGSGPRDNTHDPNCDNNIKGMDLQGWSEPDIITQTFDPCSDSSANAYSYVYVVDMKTGFLRRTFPTANQKSFMGSPSAYDKNLNFSVDAIYIPETYDANTENNKATDWKGTIYKINIPADWSNKIPENYKHNPTDWTMSKLFTSDRPITGQLSLSMDSWDNVWVYFGTGRFIGTYGDVDTPQDNGLLPDFNDRANNDSQYFYGIKDPFYNKDFKYSGANPYYLKYPDLQTPKTLNPSDLFDSGTVDVAVSEYNRALLFTSGTTTKWKPPSPYEDKCGPEGEWNTLVNYMREYEHGWYMDLDISSTGGSSERMIAKPAVIGGVVLATSYTPVNDPCLFGGRSNFYGVYYETGTAYKSNILPGITPEIYTDPDTGHKYTRVIRKKEGQLTGAPPPSIGLHTGRQRLVRAFIQLSTGEIVAIDLDPALNIRSGLTGWRDK
ncbi:MAG: hypothetical protein HQK65_09385 [Desulfamplus sp.]|nr:hypothetical protein [Desulfamplus sp.]